MEVNNSIKCGVHDCKHHAGNVEYCTLNCVSIGAANVPLRQKRAPTANLLQPAKLKKGLHQ